MNLLSVIRKSEYHGLPVDAVQAMTKQICLGLDFLHRKCAIIHTVSDSAWILNLTPSTRVVSVRRGRGWSRRWRLRAPRESRGGFAAASVPHRTSNRKCSPQGARAPRPVALRDRTNGTVSSDKPLSAKIEELSQDLTQTNLSAEERKKLRRSSRNSARSSGRRV